MEKVKLTDILEEITQKMLTLQMIHLCMILYMKMVMINKEL